MNRWPLLRFGKRHIAHGLLQPMKRRAWESNPQPVSRHLISSQAASHSLTLLSEFESTACGGD
jgi:hypothetical protein